MCNIVKAHKSHLVPAEPFYMTGHAKFRLNCCFPNLMAVFVFAKVYLKINDCICFTDFQYHVCVW